MIEGNKQELSEEEKALCERVLAEWADKGKLTFRRIPNIITVIAALITSSIIAETMSTSIAHLRRLFLSKFIRYKWFPTTQGYRNCQCMLE